MKLCEYSVSFPKYPWIDPISSFAEWDSSNPTQSLTWYDAYNAVKHSRETNFHLATLLSAFEAVTACAIMIDAQFGTGTGTRTENFFHLAAKPTWPLEDIYINLADPCSNKWSPVNFEFDAVAPHRRCAPRP